MPAGLIIRRIIPADYAGICRLHRDDQDAWSDMDDCAAWLDKRTERGFYLQAALLGEQVVGHGEWVETENAGEHFLYLGLLQIDPLHQRKGIGRAMLEDGYRYARECGITEIITFPDVETGSPIFYEKCGFTPKYLTRTCYIDTIDQPQLLADAQVIDSIPETVMRDVPFVLGLSQASSRHMWEVYNRRPRTDKRNLCAMRLSDGSYAHMAWFPGSDEGFPLLWSADFKREHITQLLAIGRACALKRVEFIYHERHEPLFISCETHPCETIIHRAV